MSLTIQWAIFLVIAGAFIGSSWWLAQSAGVEDGRAAGKKRSLDGVRATVASFDVSDWCVVSVGVAFFIPLVIRTGAALF